jgi:hypothetical protein
MKSPQSIAGGGERKRTEKEGIILACLLWKIVGVWDLLAAGWEWALGTGSVGICLTYVLLGEREQRI